MKTKAIITCLALSSAFLLQAQDSSLTSPKKHEIGIDIKSFLRQYLFFTNQQQAGSAQSAYLITYRYKIASAINLRSAIGGDYYSEKQLSGNFAPEVQAESYQYLANMRIGLEWFKEVSKLFQYYYGVDIRAEYTKKFNNASHSNDGYIYGMDYETTHYGLAPVLGLRFKINKRMSLLTESGFYFHRNEYKYRNFATPIDNNPPLAKQPPKTGNGMGVNFLAPTSIYLTVAF